MKKCFAIALAALTVFAACTKEGGVKTPTVSFETAQPLTIDGAATLSLKVSDYTGTEAVTVPVKFAGDAVKGDDYSVSAEAFVIGGSEPVTTITVTPVVYGSKKSVSASLEIPEGFAAGSYTSCSFTLSDALARCSFATKRATLGDRVAVEINLIDNSDKAYSVQNAEEIAVEVDTEKSTAVEGTDFRFKDGNKAAVFEPMTSTGKVELEYIETEESNAGKVIVLKLTPSSKYELGQYAEVSVELIGSYLTKLNGSWKIKELKTTAQYFEENMSFAASSDKTSAECYAGFPEFNENDGFSFDFEKGLFIPAFKSTFKNYYIGESTFSLGDEISLPIDNNYPPTMMASKIVILDNVNRYFSGNEFSEDKEGYVAFSFSTDENGSELLYMMTIDYEPKTFLADEFAGYDLYNDTKPVLTTTCTFLIATFKKAE